jgi:hypothetical protein
MINFQQKKYLKMQAETFLEKILILEKSRKYRLIIENINLHFYAKIYFQPECHKKYSFDD